MTRFKNENKMGALYHTNDLTINILKQARKENVYIGWSPDSIDPTSIYIYALLSNNELFLFIINSTDELKLYQYIGNRINSGVLISEIGDVIINNFDLQKYKNTIEKLLNDYGMADFSINYKG